MADGVDAGKLYLTSVDGYFLPPNCYINQLCTYDMVLTTSQIQIPDSKSNSFQPQYFKVQQTNQKKRDVKR